MAYIRSRTIREYIGVSTDHKPRLGRQSDGSTLTSTDLPMGSTFTEQDTGNVAEFNGHEWIYLAKPPREDVVGKLEEILTAINQQSATMEKILLLMAGG